MKTAADLKIILYNEEEEDNSIVRNFLSLKGRMFIRYKDEISLADHISRLKAEGYGSKDVLILTRFKGRFFQYCPGSSGMICCRYRLLNTCFNCLYNCTYCYLHSYLNSFGIIQFTNIDSMIGEIASFFKSTNSDNIYRIGTGEFTDSLMIDEVTRIAEKLIEQASHQKNIMLELKTKSNNVFHLLDIKNKGNAVLSWSLNTERNISRYERDTASLSERLKSASMAADAGYFIAFHFDPIIIYPGWEEEYRDLIKRLFSAVNPDKMVWISLGCFRYGRGFKELIIDKFPDEDITLQEMFPGIDGKFRYYKQRRRDIYKTLIESINGYTHKSYIYLCMESSDFWRYVFNKSYNLSDELEKDISEHLKRNFFNR